MAVAWGLFVLTQMLEYGMSKLKRWARDRAPLWWSMPSGGGGSADWGCLLGYRIACLARVTGSQIDLELWKVVTELNQN